MVNQLYLNFLKIEKISVDYICVGPLPLIYVSVFLPIPCCVDYHRLLSFFFPPGYECPETRVRGVEGKHEDGPRSERRGETTEWGE